VTGHLDHLMNTNQMHKLFGVEKENNAGGQL
jgi:hypothetical protein